MRLSRIERKEDVTMDVIQCSAQPHLIDTSMSCKTVDISAHGMKVSTRIPIPVNTILDLTLDSSSRLYHLQGEVRWARDEGRHYVGLRLDNDSQDINAWSKMFNSV